jgi:hypothetical protein
MPLPAVESRQFGVLAKEEASYGVAEVLSNSADFCMPFIGDGLPPDIDPITYVHGGEGRGRNAVTGAMLPYTEPAGAARTVPFRAVMKGRGSAYSAVNTPPNELHRWLKASGYDATYSATPTPQWTYTPTPAGGTPTSLTVRRFSQRKQFDDVGVMCSLSYATDVASPLGILVADFIDGQGIASIPTDQVIPTLTDSTYSVGAITVPGCVVTINSVTTRPVRKISYTRNRPIGAARHQINIAGGHAGFVSGVATPEIQIELERETAAAFDPETLRANATVFAVSWQFNAGVQYNRFTHSFAQAQIVDVQSGSADDMAITTLTIRPHPSALNLSDFESLVFN